MKRILYAILATVSGLVLLLSYRTSLGETAVSDVAAVSANTTTVAAAPQPTTPPSAGTSSDAATPSTPDAASTTASSGLADGTFVGASASTRYGDVQVQITVSGGRIVDVTVPEYPHENNKDVAINNRALPQLISETTAAQSAEIQMVSGATYTSDGYIQSLQSALDQAQA